MRFEKVLEDIKKVKIQGAENIALASAKSIKQLVRQGETYSQLLKARKQLLATRPTEPCMQNTLNFIFNDCDKNNFKQVVNNNVDEALAHFKHAKQKIAECGSQKIHNGDTIFTHCHSSTVISIFKKAKQEGKKFKVMCTETRPLYQGRITAKELSKLKIPVTMFVDSAARYALKKADFMIMGADAITSEGKVINKVGSELFAEIAFMLDVSLYVATNSWKFDPKSIFGIEPAIEQRLTKEVWPKKPKNVDISNLAFEKVSPRIVTAIISELGVLMPSNFVEEVKLHHSWMNLI